MCLQYKQTKSLFIIDTETSHDNIEAVLPQIQNEVEAPIRNFCKSRKFTNVSQSDEPSVVVERLIW